MQKNIILITLLLLTNISYSEVKNTQLNVGVSLKYNYKINTNLNTTTVNNQSILFIIKKENNVIEYYY